MVSLAIPKSLTLTKSHFAFLLRQWRLCQSQRRHWLDGEVTHGSVASKMDVPCTVASLDLVPPARGTTRIA